MSRKKWFVEATNTFEKNIRILPLNVQRRVKEEIDRLAENPYRGTILKGFQHKYWKVRVGDYRIVYTIDTLPKKVYLMTIRHRRSVYRKF